KFRAQGPIVVTDRDANQEVAVISPLRFFILLLALTLTSGARAQATRPPPLWNLRGSIGPGLMFSRDQIEALKFDRLAGVAAVQVGRTIWPWLELRASLHGGMFGSSKDIGGVLAPTLGAAIQLPHRNLRPWAGLDLGPALTGTAVRPYVAFTVGVDSRTDKNISLGPVLGYGRVVQWDGRSYTSDASYLWLGLSLRFRFDQPPKPPPAPPAPPRAVRPVRVVERVVERVEVEIEREPAPPPDDEMLRLIESAVPVVTQRTELLAPVLFKFDSDTLEAIGVAMLHEVAHQLAQRPDIRLLEIQGYADARGSQAYNQALSQRRAERVRQWLIEHGVAPERLRVAALGAAGPVEAGAEERAFEQNRRVIFRVIEQGAAP
ncbi:MAG TPA: OmpA family protein, partial [Polyangiales bacterium]|nr:OmpA family protein [Polyangiales bacterium]